MRFYQTLAILFILMSNRALAHSDFWIVKDFGNVKVRIKTGFEYEEINKGWIIGELANKLCRQLNYTKQVFIDFNHYYVGDCEPDYFLSFDDGAITENGNSKKPKPFLKQHSLVIREVSRRFSPSITLKLLEYAITNEKKIKAEQDEITYEQNYCWWKIKTIDTLLIKNIATGSLSDNINKVLSAKVYRPENDKDDVEVSYYFQDNKYYIFYNDYKVKDSVLLVLDNIYQFGTVSWNKWLVFDTDSSFYFVHGVNDPHSSNRKIIEETANYYRPFEISTIGSNKVAISFWYYIKPPPAAEGEAYRLYKSTRERNVLYLSDTDELLQDLDKLLNVKQQ